MSKTQSTRKISSMKFIWSTLFMLILLEVQATPYNIAPKAKVTASSFLNSNFNPENVTDGIIGVAGMGEWACLGDTTDWGYIRFPWIQLTWDSPQKINQLILYDRPS